jgi:regulator of protease activity HflC (stomatin/prohibitin superfamily)
MGYLIFPIILIIAIGAAGYREVKSNTRWVPIFRTRRLEYFIGEGPTWLLRFIFDKIAVDMKEKLLVVLEKKKELTNPNDDAVSHEPAHQVGESIMTRDANKHGAGYVIVSNVTAFYHPVRDEEVVPQGFQKLLRLLGWHQGKGLHAFTSIELAEVESRIAKTILDELRLILGSYPYQYITNLDFIVDGREMTREERLAIRKKISDDLLIAVNAKVKLWGVVVTSIPIGDIDPEQRIADALQSLSAQAYENEQQVMANEAIVTQAKQVHTACGDEKPVLNEFRETMSMLMRRSNERIAAEHNGNAGRLVQNLVDTAERFAAV